MATPIHEGATGQGRDTGRNDRTGGVVLIGLGVFFLLARVFDFGWLTLPILGGAFLAVGLIRREGGWLIPGGILCGLGLGIFLINGPADLTDSNARGGLFLLGFAAGWFAIAGLSLLTRDRQWWALIPGSVLALVGVTVLIGGTPARLLGLAAALWPLGLVIGGCALLIRQRAGRRAASRE